MKKVTLVMTVWNALEYTKVSLESLYQNTNQKDFDLIIFNNGSKSEVKEYLETFTSSYSNISLINEKNNIGVWRSREKATRNIKTSYIGFLDNDIYLPKDWLEKMLKELEDDSVGQVGPIKLFTHWQHPYEEGHLKKVWNKHEKRSEDIREQLALFLHSNDINTFKNDLLSINNYNPTIQVPPHCISGCCMITRTELYKSDKIMDTEYAKSKYGFEDMDYSWILAKLGYEIRVADTYVHHFEHSSVEDNSMDINAPSEQLNTIHFYHKWQHTIAEWIEQELSKEATIESIRKHFVIDLMFKIIPKHIPEKINSFFNTKECQ